MKQFIILPILLALYGLSASAQTAVYVCSETGAYGYCYGNNDVAACAYNACISYGGTSPSLILSTSSKGYGAIAVGKDDNGAQIVGAAAGYATLQDAQNRAIQECKNRGGNNLYIAGTFLDN